MSTTKMSADKLEKASVVNAADGSGAFVNDSVGGLDGLDATAGQVAALLLSRGVVVNAVTPTALRLAPSRFIVDYSRRMLGDAVLDALDMGGRRRTPRCFGRDCRFG